MPTNKITIGSKAQVAHGTAHKTPGGLTKKDIIKRKGRWVSKAKHEAGKKAYKNLLKSGNAWTIPKGSNRPVPLGGLRKKTTTKKKTATKRRSPLSMFRF